MAEKLYIAGSVEEALGLKNADSAFLAGGTEINRLDGTVNAGTLISLKRIPEIKGICEDEGMVWLGAATTFQEAVDSELVPEYFKDALKMMASRTKRNMASLAGNIALLRDDSYIVPCLIGATARIRFIRKGGEIEQTCICGYMDKKAAGEMDDALILAIGLDKERKVISKRYANTAMSHSALNVSLGYGGSKGIITIGAAIKGAGLFRLRKLEEVINSNPGITEEEIIAWVKECKACEIPSDIYGSEDYKRYLLGVTVAKMLEDSRKEA